MRLPRVRILTLMIAVAVVALGISGEKMRRRWVYCREKEALFASIADENRRAAEQAASLATESLGFDLAQAEREERAAVKYRAYAIQAEKNRRFYVRAVWRPWEATPPFPPPLK